jgi:hypothetical protein
MKMSPWILVAVGFSFGGAAGLTYGEHMQKQMAVSSVTFAEQSTERFKQLGALHKEAVEKWTACSARWNEASGMGTVILDEPTRQTHRIVPVIAGHIFPSIFRFQEDSVGTSAVRWFIPFKIQPEIYGEPGGARYGWIDKDGKFQGWFTPKKVE